MFYPRDYTLPLDQPGQHEVPNQFDSFMITFIVAEVIALIMLVARL